MSCVHCTNYDPLLVALILGSISTIIDSPYSPTFFFFHFIFFCFCFLCWYTFCWYNFLHVISFISLSLCFFSSFFLFLSLSLVFLYSVYPSFSVFSAPSLPFSLLRLPSSFPALFYPFSLPTPPHNFLMDFSFSLQFRRNCYFMKIFT